MIDQAVLGVFTSALQPCVQVFYVGASKEVDKQYILLCNILYWLGLSVFGILGYTGTFFDFYEDNFTMEDKEESSTYFMVCLATI